MSIQFKKFMIGLVSVILGAVAVYLFNYVYLESVGAGNTFGAELVIFDPVIFILGAIVAYSYLKKFALGFQDGNSIQVQERLGTREWLTLLLWMLVSSFTVLDFWPSEYNYRIQYKFLMFVIIWALIGPFFVRLLRRNDIKQGLFWIGLVAVLYFLFIRIGLAFIS